MRVRVEGRQPLNGIYRPSGNPNAAVSLLAAALLTDQPVTLSNMPRTASTQVMLDLAAWMGAELGWQNESNESCLKNESRLKIITSQIAKRSLTPAETNGFVGALLTIAPILARRGYVRLEIDFPLNRIRTHLDALRDLGQGVVTMDGAVEIRAVKWGFKDIVLSQTSVTATSIAMMLAAALGEETIIRSSASEPHVQELGMALEKMGVQIQGIGSNVLHIFGGQPLHGFTAAIGPNHIEVGSIAAISALCGGRVQIDGIRRADLRIIDRTYRRLGIQLDIDETVLYIPKHEALIVSNREEDVDASIQTAPWPGFPSDLVAIATVVATQARGTSLIHEWMFNNRLLFVDKLIAMSAQIILCDPHRAIVVGPTPLYPIYMDSPDIRAGLAMMSAALIADGESVIDNAQALGRSFEEVFEKLQALGAKIVVE